VYAADNEITVSITGKAVLLGLESGSSSSHEDYKANKRKALHGRMVAYVLLEKNAGKVNVGLTAEGLKSQRISIK
jgi:hypothetical protein